MDAPAFDATRFVRLALRSIVFCFSIIVISSMTMVKPAHASGTVAASTNTYLVGGGQYGTVADYINAATPGAACDIVMYWPGYTSHAVVTILNAATQVYQCTYTYLANTNLPSSYWGTTTYIDARYEFPTCPANSALTGSTCTCNDPYVPDATQTSCVIPACPDHASGMPCTCDTGYKFDAAGTSCVSTCPVDPLPKPPPPFTDACSNSLEKGRGVDIDNACAAGLTPDMKDGAQCVADKIHALAIPYTGPSATVRTTAYQNHLLAVWNKSEEIKNKDDWLPGEKQACVAVITDVNNEMGWHGIDSPPSSSEDLAPHVLGRAIDIPRNVAKTLIAQVTNTTFVANCIVCLPLPVITGDVQDYVNSSRINPPACNLNWGGRFKKPRPDPVHFQLP